MTSFTEDEFRQVTAQVPGMVFRLHLSITGEMTYLFVSDGVRELYGIEPQAVMANSQILQPFRHPDDDASIDADLKEAATSALPMLMQFRIMLPNGVVKWVQITSTQVEHDATGSVRSGIMIDITARKLAEIALRETEERWKLALESTGDGVWDWYVQDGREYYSKRYKEMYGYGDDKVWQEADDYHELVHPDDRDQLVEDQFAHFYGETAAYSNEHRVRCKDGSWKWVLSRGMVIARDAAGRPLRMIGTHTDISQRKESQAQIWRQANFDPLTGLPNRRNLRARLETEIAACAQTRQRLAILFIDLDHFKEVNDSLGHDNGDLLLVQAARRIQDCLGAKDVVGRMGGDEFTVVLGDVQVEFGAAAITPLEHKLQSILDTLSHSFELGTEQVFVSGSMGITFYPTDATRVEDLFKHADQALYVAKRAGRNRYSFFSPELQEAARTRARLATDLRGGMAQSQFEVVYQPIVHLKSGITRKAEALLRWHHPVRGLVSPAQFIGIAESSGMIIDIGDWVFHQAAAQVKQWRSQFHPQFQISVNKSPVQFHHEGRSPHSWIDHLKTLGLPGSSVAIEITENLLLDAGPKVTGHLLDMRDAGIQVALDDFGTGYSSLSYLQKFDIDYIKIDQSFVRNLTPTSTDLILCKAIIVMAHALGMTVIAEGIETRAQHDLLLAAGCDYGQGYLLARPMPVAACEAFLQSSPLNKTWA
jgi:diguanylate cyclase (GGDEF)-like protein/PAS domain S-box-containing protein